MPKLIWCVLCQAAIVDSQSNLASYINCLEGITAKHLPVELPSMTLGCLWDRDGGSAKALQFRIKLVGPDRKVRFTFDSEQIPMDKPHCRANVSVVGQKFDQPGEYRFSVYLKRGDRWKNVSELPFLVQVSEEQESQA